MIMVQLEQAVPVAELLGTTTRTSVEKARGSNYKQLMMVLTVLSNTQYGWLGRLCNRNTCIMFETLHMVKKFQQIKKFISGVCW